MRLLPALGVLLVATLVTADPEVSAPNPEAEAANKAAEEQQKKVEAQWNLMLKLNKDAFDLMNQWKPKDASIKGMLDDLKALGEMAGGLGEARQREAMPTPWKEKATERFGELRGVLAPGKPLAPPAASAASAAEPAPLSAATLLRQRARLNSTNDLFLEKKKEK